MALIRALNGSSGGGGGYKTDHQTKATSSSPDTFTFSNLTNVYSALIVYSSKAGYSYIDEGGNLQQATISGGMTITAINGNTVTFTTPYDGTSLTYDLYAIGS